MTVLFLSVLRCTDLLLTWIYTPDLGVEYNPIVSIFGISWAGLISTQILLLLIVSVFGAFYFFKVPIKVTQKDLVFGDFVYCYFFHELKGWLKRFFSKPTDKNAHLIFNGFMLLSVSILISMFAIINNLLLILEIGWYEQFLMSHYSVFFPTVFLLVTVISFLIFFSREYHRYLTQNNQNN